MTGLEIAVGFVIAWTARRAKHLSDSLGTGADEMLDQTVEALHQLVAGKLSGDPALAQLQDETEREGEPNPRTKKRVQLALEDAVEQDPGFARLLEALTNKAEQADRLSTRCTPQSNAPSANTGLRMEAGAVSASNQGVAFGSVVGPVNLTQSNPAVETCRNCSRDAIGQCLECHDPLCGVHNLATRQRTIATPDLVAILTVQALWANAADKVLCGACLTGAEEDLLLSLPATPLPTDPKPAVRLIALGDRAYWSIRQHKSAWMDALCSAVDELGGQLAVFDAAAAAVLNRTEIEDFPGSRRRDVFQGAVVGEEVRTYEPPLGSSPTGRLIAVNRDLDWFYVSKMEQSGACAVEQISSNKLQRVSTLIDLAIPAFTDYVQFPQFHDLMPDPWAMGQRSCTYDNHALVNLMAAHRWI